MYITRKKEYLWQRTLLKNGIANQFRFLIFLFVIVFIAIVRIFGNKVSYHFDNITGY